MATTKGQRIGIWIIAVFMVFGTIGSFAMIVIANSNEQNDQARLNELMSQYQADTDAQANELSEKYYDKVNKYASRADEFDASKVTELQTKDLEVGDGEAITSESSFSAYYIGWKPDGIVFDSSIDGDTLKEPFSVTPGGVIEGWTEGVDGMKVGGVRELTLPADLAYGESGSGDLIPPNTPLKFVVVVIPTPEPVEIPEELLRYYQTGGA